MPYKDPEKQKEYNRLYLLNNKEKEKERQRLYRINNQQKIKERNRLYRLNNKEILKERRESYVGLKSKTISHWRLRGVKDHFNDNYETLYRIYLSTKFCDYCGYELNTGDNKMRKCLDHDHDSNYFRGVVCHSCNARMPIQTEE